MNLETVEIPRTAAREQAAEYRREARRTRDPVERHELEQIATAYRIAAREGVSLIALTPTLAAGGTMTRTNIWHRGSTMERRSEYLLPNLAVCRWQARFCYTLGVQADGGIEFIDSLGHDWRYRKGRVTIGEGTFTLPDGYEWGRPIENRWDISAWAAMVPIVPPRHRPATGMGDLLVLWEVDDWRWETVPRPPGDPALLRHVGGDIYAVEATWELTELEKLVLSGRRRP
jgi:hypothetical protein